jgi:opacity protein-like surface antigen
MRSLFPLFLLAAATLPLSAQSNEIGFQFGKTVSEGRRFRFDGFPNNVFDEGNGYAAGFTYNRKLAGGDGVALNLHAPIFVFENKAPDGSFNQSSFRDSSSATGFITPGLQVRFLQPFFLQPYVFAGVGYARVAELTPRDGIDDISFENRGTWGVSAGGGVDLVFGRHFGLRGEIRSLTAGGRDRVIPGLTLDDPATRWAATGGLIFRF